MKAMLATMLGASHRQFSLERQVSAEANEGLDARIDALEHSIARLRKGIVMLVLTVVAGMSLAATSEPDTSEVRARAFVLEDSFGTERGRWEAHELGTGVHWRWVGTELKLTGDDQGDRVELAVTPLGVVVRLKDDEQGGFVSLGIREGRLVVFNRSGEQVVVSSHPPECAGDDPPTSRDEMTTTGVPPSLPAE